jgi:hypothetical protein
MNLVAATMWLPPVFTPWVSESKKARWHMAQRAF